MANHAYVKTKKKITIEAVDDILKTANKTIFRNCLKIEKWKDSKKPTWSVEIVSKKNKKRYGGPVHFWLNNSKSLEVRHSLIDINWWFDFWLQNEIACQFDGIRTDDGTNSRQKGIAHKYDNIFLVSVDGSTTKIKRFYLYGYYKGEVPPEFIDDVNEKHGFKTEEFQKEYKAYLRAARAMNKLSPLDEKWHILNDKIVKKLNLNEKV